MAIKISGTTVIDDSRNIQAVSLAGAGPAITSLNASNLASGQVAAARLGSGTAQSGNFLRGDLTWAAAGGSGVLTNFTALTSGTTFTTQPTTTKLYVECHGGGGGGGGGGGSSVPSGRFNGLSSPGNSGAFGASYFQVSGNQALQYAIGAGGAAGGPGGHGPTNNPGHAAPAAQAGGNTTFQGTPTSQIIATGGTAGGTGAAYTPAGSGAAAPFNAENPATGATFNGVGRSGLARDTKVGSNAMFFGQAASGRGGGGGAGVRLDSSAPGLFTLGPISIQAGAGTAGIILVWEFA